MSKVGCVCSGYLCLRGTGDRLIDKQTGWDVLVRKSHCVDFNDAICAVAASSVIGFSHTYLSIEIQGGFFLMYSGLSGLKCCPLHIIFKAHSKRIGILYDMPDLV